jgi:hypothetical protein
MGHRAFFGSSWGGKVITPNNNHPQTINDHIPISQ